MDITESPPRRHWLSGLPGLAVWALAWGALPALDGRLDLPNLAMVLLLASAVASLWLPVAASMGLTLLSLLAFNWLFVPPRHTFAVDLRQDALLLGATLAVGTIVALLMSRQRRLADSARRHAAQAVQL